MDKKIRIIGIIAAVAVSFVILSLPSNPLPIPEPLTSEIGTKSVQVLATNLEKPRSFDFSGDKIFLTEKGGSIRVIDSGVLIDEPLANLRVAEVAEGGLLGIATHPNFEENHFLYVYYTYVEDEELWNKVLRITESDNKLKEANTILDKIPASKFNNGGIIKFGPDMKLYIAVGSGTDHQQAQNIESLAGKILRLNDDGTIPENNPYLDSPVFSYGHRNPQGMTWDNAGNLYVTEIGPSQNDEINLVKPGQNYGWPEQECSGDKKYVDALVCYDPAFEPGGIVYYSSEDLNLHNSLIVASLRASNLYQLEMNEGEIVSQKSILSGLGRLRDVNEGPDGYLYVLTSNTDGKGFPDNTDDKLLRIVK